jgi:hypothetical protein
MSQRSVIPVEDAPPRILNYRGPTPPRPAKRSKGSSVRGLSVVSFIAIAHCAIFLALISPSPHRLDSLDLAMSAIVWVPAFFLGAVLWIVAAAVSLDRFARKKKFAATEILWLLIAAVSVLCFIGFLSAVPSHGGGPGGW